MSEFSDFCNMLREESGMTIYHIAKVSGIERTALNRMLNGRRFPKYEDVDLFCEVLRASEKEKEHIRKLYLMEKVGKSHYENYRYIQDLLCELDQGESYAMPPEQILPGNTDGDRKPFVSGRKGVKNLICNILEQEYRQQGIAGVYTNFPVHEDTLPAAVGFYEKKYKKEVPLCHFHILNVNPEKYYDSGCNLKVLHSALKWIFSKGRSYIPYYTYSQTMLNDLELQFMPYYLITDCTVLLVSDNFQQGILLEEPDMVLFYQKRMLAIRQQMHRLFQMDVEMDTGKKVFPKEEEGENDRICTPGDSGRKLQHIDVGLCEKGVILSREGAMDGGLTVMVTESSLCKSFHDYFSYLNEMADIEEVRKCGLKKGCTPDRTY